MVVGDMAFALLHNEPTKALEFAEGYVAIAIRIYSGVTLFPGFNIEQTLL